MFQPLYDPSSTVDLSRVRLRRPLGPQEPRDADRAALLSGVAGRRSGEGRVQGRGRFGLHRRRASGRLAYRCRTPTDRWPTARRARRAALGLRHRSTSTGSRRSTARSSSFCRNADYLIYDATYMEAEYETLPQGVGSQQCAVRGGPSGAQRHGQDAGPLPPPSRAYRYPARRDGADRATRAADGRRGPEGMELAFGKRMSQMTQWEALTRL